MSEPILHCGDCRAVLPALPENHFDACVTDPPYHLGFMGQRWDGGDIAFDPATWHAVMRVLKPGAHAVVFCIPKHIGFVQVAMQEAGFEFRDVIVWAFGSGFPKSHDVSKGIDKAAGAEREAIGAGQWAGRGRAWTSADGAPDSGYKRPAHEDYGERLETAPATDAAREWQGWGTALKPAVELIILARKPLSEGTVVANVLRWGTGAINVDGCRIEGVPQARGLATGLAANKFFSDGECAIVDKQPHELGRWPANLTHDGSAEVMAGFPESKSRGGSTKTAMDIGYHGNGSGADTANYGSDSGSAARFFYTAKADADDRLGSRHPTVKPLDLMQWLCRLICRRGGSVLDPFAGTGTTGEAAWREGMVAELIERELQYCDDVRRRLSLLHAGMGERTRASIKARNVPRDDGPLFDWRPL